MECSHPLLLFLPSFLLLLLSPSQALNHNFSDCEPVLYNCGALVINISYPFLVAGHPNYCGHPGFYLNHINNKTTLIISINNHHYQVKNIDYYNQNLDIVDTDVLDQTCLQEFHNTTIDNSLFTYGGRNRNLTLYFNCTSSPDVQAVHDNTCLTGDFGRHSYYRLGNENSLDVSRVCSSTAIMPLDDTAAEQLERDGNLTAALQKGFSLKWNLGSNWCNSCMNSGGRCGYDSNNPDDHKCFCPNSTTIGLCNTDAAEKHNDKRKWIAIGVSGFGGLILVCFLIFLLQWRHRKFHNLIFCKQKTDSFRAMEDFLENYGTLAPKSYTYSEVKRITRTFRNKLGQGGYGVVFHGTLSDGHEVAVKVLSESKGTGEEFINEVASIGKTSHVNVVSLLGFCLEGRKRALIYDFMPNGSLENYIYSKNSNGTRPFGWETLYKIAVGIARGLEYLHRGCNTRIVHFDIKPHNILLDADFCPKISDFGLAKLCPDKDSKLSMDGVRGTIGYIAPEVFSRSFGVISSKSDVYSYGMMVLEMVGGRKNGNDKTSEVYFPDWIYEHLDRDCVLQDWGVTIETEEIAIKMIQVGLWCIQTMPTNRPSIGRVVEMLCGSVNDIEMPPKPCLSSPVRSIIESSTMSTS